jgi:hypothetical protein
VVASDSLFFYTGEYLKRHTLLAVQAIDQNPLKDFLPTNS